MPHAEVTASDWIEMAAEARRLADAPGCTAECREYHEHAAMDSQTSEIGGIFPGKCIPRPQFW
jgi:hypothetical protein